MDYIVANSWFGDHANWRLRYVCCTCETDGKINLNEIYCFLNCCYLINFFFLRAMSLGCKPSPMEPFVEMHVRSEDRQNKVQKFVDNRAQHFVVCSFNRKLSIPFRFVWNNRNISYQFKKRSKTKQFSSHFKSRPVPDFPDKFWPECCNFISLFCFGLEKPLNQTQTSTYFNQNKLSKYHININNSIFNYKTIFNQSKNKKTKKTIIIINLWTLIYFFGMV